MKWRGTLRSCHRFQGSCAKAEGRLRNYLPLQQRSARALKPRTQYSSKPSWFIESQAGTITADSVKDPHQCRTRHPRHIHGRTRGIIPRNLQDQWLDPTMTDGTRCSTSSTSSPNRTSCQGSSAKPSSRSATTDHNSSSLSPNADRDPSEVEDFPTHLV